MRVRLQLHSFNCNRLTELWQIDANTKHLFNLKGLGLGLVGYRKEQNIRLGAKSEQESNLRNEKSYHYSTWYTRRRWTVLIVRISKQLTRLHEAYAIRATVRTILGRNVTRRVALICFAGFPKYLSVSNDNANCPRSNLRVRQHTC